MGVGPSVVATGLLESHTAVVPKQLVRRKSLAAEASLTVTQPVPRQRRSAARFGAPYATVSDVSVMHRVLALKTQKLPVMVGLPAAAVVVWRPATRVKHDNATASSTASTRPLGELTWVIGVPFSSPK